MPLVLAEVDALAAILTPLGGQPITLLVTGSRTWSDREAVHSGLAMVHAAAGQPVTLRHGAARALDMVCATWASNRRGWILDPYPVTPASWHALGRRAGMLRNAEMVRSGASLCCAWVNPCADPRCTRPRPHGSHGTSGCADLAEKAGIPTWRCER